MKFTTRKEQIWIATYAAAFVEDAARMATTVNTSVAAAAEHADWRASIAEAARGMADSAILGLGETKWAET